MAKKLNPYQAHMKRELKGKMKGKTKAQRKAIFKAAAKSYKSKSPSRKSTGAKSKSGSSVKRNTSKGGTRRVGKRSFNLSKIFKYVRYGALALPAAARLMTTDSPESKARHLSQDYLGYDFKTRIFKLEWLARGWTPFVAANIITVGVPKLISIIRSL